MYKLEKNEYDRILEIKRDIHMHPELAHHEFRTTEVIRNSLRDIPGLEFTGWQPETGLLARITGDGTGREVMLRADIDAIPQEEAYESPWRSVNDGVMHACGHDFHTAGLIGAAHILGRLKKEGKLKNTVDLVFQPAEEGTTGARMLIDGGLFDVIHPEVCFGLHNWPSVPSGKVVCHVGGLMAGKRNFEIRITGSGGHGSMPHLNHDPIVCSAAVIQSLQTVVSRNIDPMDHAVLSISMIEGGRPVNVVADSVRMVGTIRAVREETLERAASRAETLVREIASSYECEGEIIWQVKIPALDNREELLEFARRCAEECGAEATDWTPSLASEDFALYQKHIPGFFYWVGSTKPGDHPEDLHRPMFHTDDDVLGLAAELLARSAGEYR